MKSRALWICWLLFLSSLALGAAQDPETSLSASQTAESWELTVPVGHATVVIPKAHLQLEKLPAAGATASPRYFFLVDKTEGETVFAGWLESSEGVKDVAQKLQATVPSGLQHLKAAGFDVRSVESGHIGDWATISYTVTHSSIEGKYSAHIRAMRVAGDTWIDLHLSVTRATSLEDCQKTVVNLLQTVTVRLR